MPILRISINYFANINKNCAFPPHATLLFRLEENSTDGSSRIPRDLSHLPRISSNLFRLGHVTGRGVHTLSFGYAQSCNIANIPKPVCDLFPAVGSEFQHVIVRKYDCDAVNRVTDFGNDIGYATGTLLSRTGDEYSHYRKDNGQDPFHICKGTDLCKTN